MEEKYLSGIEIEERFNLYLKVVTAVRTFDNFNSFFNIYDMAEEPCRRIVVLTPYKDLEEVYDEPSLKNIENEFVEGNLWIKDYPLTTNPKDIDIFNIKIKESIVKNFKEIK